MLEEWTPFNPSTLETKSVSTIVIIMYGAFLCCFLFHKLWVDCMAESTTPILLEMEEHFAFKSVNPRIAIIHPLYTGSQFEVA